MTSYSIKKKYKNKKFKNPYEKGRDRDSIKVRDTKKLKGLKNFRPYKIEGDKIIFIKEE